MADSLQIRAGAKAKMPTLAVRELVYCTDEKALYIGTPEGNTKIGANLEKAVKDLSDKVDAMELVLQGHDETLADIEEEMQTQSEALTEMKNDIGGKLTANKVTSQAGLAADADTAAIVTAVNNLIAAMKASGVMNN